MLAKQQIEPPLVVYEVETASQFAEADGYIQECAYYYHVLY